MYSALTVARYIIKRYASQGKTISNLKLQKILYFVQAEFLVAKGRPCFAEDIEAWSFGPVVPEVYHEFKIYGAGGIPTFGRAVSPGWIADEDQELINGIMEECARYSASDLVSITHRQTPWIEAYRQHNNIISQRSIYEYFA